MSHDFVVGYILHFVIPFLFPTNSFSHDFVVGYILHFAIPFLFPTNSSWATYFVSLSHFYFPRIRFPRLRRGLHSSFRYPISISHDFVVGYILRFVIPFLFPTTSSWATSFIF